MRSASKYGGVLPTTKFPPSVTFLTRQAHSVIVSYILIILLSATSQASFGVISSYLQTRSAGTISFAEQPLAVPCPKASWVLVLSRCGKSLLHGAWAGRCIIAHLDDCWGPS
ncbi:hypothetical protein K443DRAFT_655045 [Laccaria amethystina LaAM-08-1]|uniref:Uncharacterized protein n=1 Tax=Laccaria amethystina LaAM-08-1 TaxID=1095629 RepID=A0A0C9X449_9AGAR|nr:hypothetical protein K443DRAFT_655045 [Laccaria amethystina LaAM-08-1]